MTDPGVHIELDRAGRCPTHPSRPARLVAAFAAVAVVSGAIGGLVTSRAQGGPAVAAAHTVRFVNDTDNGDPRVSPVDYAYIDGEQVASNSDHQATIAAVLTVRAPSGGRARCMILVDGVLFSESTTADGHSATCVWIAGVTQPPGWPSPSPTQSKLGE